jgi:DNA-binding transcriptional LysR family regulator
LSNAIRALEAALGAPLFERTVTGSELTAFGRGMLPILARIHDDRTRALEFAHSFDCSSNGKAVARSGLPRLQSWPERAGRLAKSGRRTGTLALAVLLACAAIAIGGSASAGENGVEAAIREMLPAPFRCSRTTEPALYCRHDTAADRTMVLELVSGSDGPSASLTHDYDDARRHEFFATMRGFFVRLGVSADAFDECISQSQWQPAHQSGIGHRVLCYRIELGDRVTHEVFVQAADEVPKLADAGEAAR